jgi:hypothetical protein
LKRLALFALACGACVLGTGTFAGKECASNVECPFPYVCSQVRPGSVGTCELVRGVEIFDPSGASPADFCHDTCRVLNRSCVSNCHGTDMSYPGVITNFRLDVFPATPGKFGAGDMAARIKARMDEDTMPPMVAGLARPSPDEKTIITRWVNSGAPECLGDAGGYVSGSTGDGGCLGP